MSFEIIDNGIQVGLFLLFALFSLIQGLYMQNRRFLILAGTYASFSMGTLYYLLYLVIMGKVPQVFYVSEMAWMASYLFLLALCLMETRRYRGKLDVLVLGLTIVEAAMVIGWKILGPSYPFTIAFALVTACIFYYALLGYRMEKRMLMLAMVLVIVWQLLLYIVSVFTTGYTHFNLYFAVDFLLMATMCSLFLWLKKEECK